MQRNSVEIAADIVRLSDSGLFDTDWYAATYGGAIPAGGDPLVHFCNAAWLNGFNPNPFFDCVYYLGRNPALRQAGLNPLLHYLDRGEGDGRQPSEDFDAAQYRAAQGVAKDENCLADFLARRRAGAKSAAAAAPTVAETPVPQDAAEAEVIRQSGLFDAAHYRICAHLADPGIDPVAHYCQSGWRQHFDPNPVFSTGWYLRANPEVSDAGLNPLYHYIKYGEYEGRRPAAMFDPVVYRATHEVPPYVSSLGHHLLHRAAEPAPGDSISAAIAHRVSDEQLVTDLDLFDINYYLANYPDVRESALDPAAHFMSYGWREGRRPNPYFDCAWYATTYLAPDRPENPLLHYIVSGERAGHRPIVYFDPSWYRQTYGLAADDSPLRHYLRHRRGQRHSPLRLFDAAGYVEAHGPRIGRNRDPFAHYLRVGIGQDIDPGPEFDARRYRLAHMEQEVPRPHPAAGAEVVERLRREPLNPLVHFLLNEAAGKGEWLAQRA